MNTTLTGASMSQVGPCLNGLLQVANVAGPTDFVDVWFQVEL